MSEKRRYKELLKAIKYERLRKKIKQIEMGNALSINQASYAQIENGETALTLDRLLEICEKLELSPFQLLRKDFKDEIYLKRTEMIFTLMRYRHNQKERVQRILDHVSLIHKKLEEYENSIKTGSEVYPKDLSDILTSYKDLYEAFEFHFRSEFIESITIDKERQEVIPESDLSNQ